MSNVTTLSASRKRHLEEVNQLLSRVGALAADLPRHHVKIHNGLDMLWNRLYEESRYLDELVWGQQ